MEFLFRIVALFLIWQESTCFAASFIESCVSLETKTQTLTISKSTVVIAHNLKTKNLWFIVEGGFSTKLKSKLWTALFLRPATYNFTCVESEPGHEQRVPCETKLAIYTKDIKVDDEDIKNHWLAENKSLTAIKHAVDEVERKNIDEKT